ncbi:MAG: DNA polymerase III subunit beta [bacterium]|nr:DNA polymerase III subunit beta [bacterium]
MKVECVLEKLKEVVPQVDRVTGKNLALPVLNAILMVASGKTLKFRATNLDLGIEIEVPAKIDKEGVVLIPGGVLNSVITSLYSSKNAILEKHGPNLSITTSHNKILIKTYPEEDFPTIPVVSGEEMVFDVEKIIAAFRSVSYSAALSDIKPEISSVYVYEHGSDLVCVATDSFRLAEKKIKLKKPSGINNILIPIRNIIEVVRIFDGKHGEVKLVMGKNQIAFSYENIYLTSRVIDGAFPDYKQILPKEHHTEAVVLKHDLINAMRTAAIFSGKFNELKIVIAPKQRKFEFHTKHPEVGENVTTIEGALSGDPIEANFNYRYIFDSLQSINDDSVALYFTTEHKPLVIKGVKDASFLYLVMPLNR